MFLKLLRQNVQISTSETVAITISELEQRLPNIIGKDIDDATSYLSDYDMKVGCK